VAADDVTLNGRRKRILDRSPRGDVGDLRTSRYRLKLRSAVGGAEFGVQPGETGVEALVEFGGAVVGGESGGEATDVGELAGWEVTR